MKRDGEGDRLKRRLAALAATPQADPSAAGSAGAEKPASKKKPRAEARTPTWRLGRIIYGGQHEVACVIRDMTSSGAKAVLEGEAALPPDVTLVISQLGTRRKAIVVWQNDREVGLSFSDAAG